ncbi:MAG: threonine/serine dehydratase [Acidobacteria bacterium]|nr:threonine/serine dehydratase [Acidobacteriota bacterium]
MITDHVHAIRSAAGRLDGIVRRTPFQPANWLSRLDGDQVFLKLENLQVTGAFKIRGAANKLHVLKEQGYAGPVLAVSAGNHGLAVAVSARSLGWTAAVVVPESAARYKIEAIQNAGAELLKIGAGYDEAEAAAHTLSARRGIPFISPYNDEAIIAGQATIGMEMLEADPSLDVILAPVGGGGLLAGITWALDAASASRPVLMGAQAKNSPGMYESLKAGRIVQVAEEPTIADGIAGNIESESQTFEIIRRGVRGVVLVEESEIRRAVVELYREESMIVEPTGAVALAAWRYHRDQLPGGRVGIVVSGGNLDPATLQDWLNE